MKLKQCHNGEIFQGALTYGYMYGSTVYSKHKGVHRLMTRIPFRNWLWVYHRSESKPKFRNIVAIQWALYFTVWPLTWIIKGIVFIGLCIFMIPYTLLFDPLFRKNYDDSRSTSIVRCLCLLGAIAVIAFLLLARSPSGL